MSWSYRMERGHPVPEWAGASPPEPQQYELCFGGDLDVERFSDMLASLASAPPGLLHVGPTTMALFNSYDLSDTIAGFDYSAAERGALAHQAIEGTLTEADEHAVWGVRTGRWSGRGINPDRQTDVYREAYRQSYQHVTVGWQEEGRHIRPAQPPEPCYDPVADPGPAERPLSRQESIASRARQRILAAARGGLWADRDVQPPPAGFGIQRAAPDYWRTQPGGLRAYQELLRQRAENELSSFDRILAARPLDQGEGGVALGLPDGGLEGPDASSPVSAGDLGDGGLDRAVGRLLPSETFRLGGGGRLVRDGDSTVPDHYVGLADLEVCRSLGMRSTLYGELPTNVPAADPRHRQGRRGEEEGG